MYSTRTRIIIYGLLWVMQGCYAQDDNVFGTLIQQTKKGFLTINDIPGIDQVTIPRPLKNLFTNLVIRDPVVEQKDIGIQIRGTVIIDGITAEVKGFIKAGFAGVMQLTPDGAVRASLGFVLPKAPKFAKLARELQPLDSAVEFSRVGFIISTYDYQDDYWNVWIEAGVNLVGTALFDPHSKVATIVPGINQLNMQAVLTPTITGSGLRGIWPVQLTLARGVTTTDVTVVLEIPEESVINTGPTLAIETGVLVQVPNQKEPLDFRTAWTLGTLDVKIEGAMDGMWHNPMGLRGIDIGNVGIEATINYVATGAGVPLTGFGLRGKVAVGSKSVEVGGLAKISSATPFGQMVFFGELQGGLYLSDIVALAGSLYGAKIPADQLPNFGFKQVNIYIAPMGGELAEKTFVAGVTIDGTFSIGDATATIDIHANDTGTRGFGHISPVTFGPLSITGAGPDMITGTADDGAIINLQLDALKQALFIDGNVELALFGGITTSGRVQLTKSGCFFHTKADAFGTQLNLAVSVPLQNPAMGRVHGEFTQEALDQCARYLEQAAQSVVDSARADIELEKQKTHAKIKSLAGRIRTKKRQCKKANVVACGEIVSLGTQLTGYYIHERILLKAGIFGSQAVANIAHALASATNSTVNVQEISFDAQASELVHAKLPQVKVRATIFGVHVEETMQLDLQDLSSWTVEVIEKIKNRF